MAWCLYEDKVTGAWLLSVGNNIDGSVQVCIISIALMHCQYCSLAFSHRYVKPSSVPLSYLSHLHVIHIHVVHVRLLHHHALLCLWLCWHAHHARPGHAHHAAHLLLTTLQGTTRKKRLTLTSLQVYTSHILYHMKRSPYMRIGT